MEEYRHCVFCASNSCTKEIEVAKHTAEIVGTSFDLDNDVVECAYHSQVTVMNEGANTSVWLSNNTLSQLIDDCMHFAVELYQLKK